MHSEVISVPVPRLGDNRLGCGANGLIMCDGPSDRGSHDIRRLNMSMNEEWRR